MYWESMYSFAFLSFAFTPWLSKISAAICLAKHKVKDVLKKKIHTDTQNELLLLLFSSNNSVNQLVSFSTHGNYLRVTEASKMSRVPP